MPTGAITPYIDVAQVVLYAFWIFFAGLVIYLQRESKREGYPLVTGHKGERLEGFPTLPAPKTFLLPNGKTRSVPWNEPIEVLNAKSSAPWDGAPIIPLGDPMQDGLGPAAFTQRDTDPELMPEGEARIVPLRVATDHWVASEDPDPRGAAVICCDRQSPGTVVDIWIDRADQMAVWLEASLAADPARRVLVPIMLARVTGGAPGQTVKVMVKSVTAAQFAAAPALAHPDQISPREEDRLMAYFASGHLYATPQRAEPLL